MRDDRLFVVVSIAFVTFAVLLAIAALCLLALVAYPLFA